jgi:nucleoside-diphosphate-sugar epimerase
MSLGGQLAVPATDGTMLPIYVDDLVAAILAGLERGVPGEAYAVWDGVPRTFEDHFAHVAEAAGGRPPRSLPRPVLALAAGTVAAAARLRGADPPFGPAAITYVDRRGTVSPERARRELGWEPRVPYEEGMRLTAAWLRRAL